MKFRFAVLCTLLAVLCLTPCASAADAEAEQAAEALYALDLFRGTETNTDGSPVFDLDAVPSRNQAVMMLVRLLGKEAESRREWDIPFTDVVPGTQSYYAIGYAYAYGLTKGTTETTYSGVQPVTRNQYLLFLLRAMGYDKDAYTPQSPLYPSDAAVLAERLDILRDGDGGTDGGSFTRGDVARYSLRALDTYMKYVTMEDMGENGGVATLREYLGLGWSPALVRTTALEPTHNFSSVEEARAVISGNPILEELPVSGGTVVHYTRGEGLGDAQVHVLAFYGEDGTRTVLPLPPEKSVTPNAHFDITRYAAPENLRYDAETNTVSYEVTIGDLQEMYFETVRRAGTYRCDCNLSELTVTFTELLEKRPTFGAPLRTGRMEEAAERKYDSPDAAREAALNDMGSSVGRGSVKQEISIPAGNLTEGGTVLYYEHGGLPHGNAPRLKYIQLEGTVFSLTLPVNGIGDAVSPEELSFDGTFIRWNASIGPLNINNPTGRTILYRYRYVPGYDSVYVVREVDFSEE